MNNVNGVWLPDNDTYFAPFIKETGGFQLDHLHKALSYVEDFSMAVDGGAHIGTWSKEMASWFAIVLAFEPCAYTFECLHRNVENNLNVVTVPAGLGEKNEYLYITEDTKRIGNTGSNYISYGNGMNKVQIKALDNMELPNLGFIKLDVEGFEYFVLKGAERTLRKFKPVVIVEEKNFGPRFGLAPFAASQFLLSLGAKEVDVVGKDHIFKW